MTEEMKADIRRIERRITEVSQRVQQETSEGARKLREESREKYERDVEILKADLAKLKTKVDSASNTAGTRFTRGLGESLGTLGEKVSQLGRTLTRDADESAPQATPTPTNRP
jgi:predicted  nucleic acid-binding Zn-ribbon protein